MNTPGDIRQWNNIVDNPLIDAPEFYRWIVLLLALAFSIIPLLPVGELRFIEFSFYLVGGYVLFRYSPVARSSYPAWLMLIVVGQMMVTWVFMLIDHPELARSGPTIEDYLDKFAFLIVAIALGGNPKSLTKYFVLLTILVFSIPWLIGDGLSDFSEGFGGMREGLGLNPIRTALYLSLVTLGLICFRRRFVKGPSVLSLGALIWVVLLLSCIGALLITQTRGVFACLMLVILVFGFLGGWKQRHLLARNKHWILAITLPLVMLAALASRSDLVQENYDKFGAEFTTVEKIFSGDLNSLPNSSWGLRAQFWIVGVKWISERPLTGWGYRAGRYVLSQEAITQKQFRPYRQLHNSYLEMMVRYGIGGLLIMLSIFVWTLYGSCRACRRGTISKDMRNFFVTSIVFFMMTANFYGLFFDDVYGLHILSIVLGVPVSFILRDKLANRPDRAVQAPGTA